MASKKQKAQHQWYHNLGRICSVQTTLRNLSKELRGGDIPYEIQFYLDYLHRQNDKKAREAGVNIDKKESPEYVIKFLDDIIDKRKEDQ